MLGEGNNYIWSWTGALFLCYCGLKFLSTLTCFFKNFFIFSTFPLENYGTWSVVTGSTSGIGKAIALELAKRGQNIVLIARSLQKLQKVEEEISSRYDVIVKCLQIDFNHDESIYAVIEECLKVLDIGILINNVGCPPKPGPFVETPNLPSHIKETVKVNILSLFKMHEIVLPAMVRKKRGLILNISSAGAVRPSCYFTLYSSSKALIDYFSKSIADEVKEYGVTVQSVQPFAVSTQMTANLPHDGFFILTPAQYAKSLFTQLGCGIHTHGAWQHAIQVFVWKLLPSSIIKAINKKLVSVYNNRISFIKQKKQ